MALANTSRAQLRYILESAFGLTPSVGNPSELRMTGESLAFQIGTETSKEIRDDRQISDLVQVSAQAMGGVNFELSYLEYDELLEAVMQGAWVEFGTAGVGDTFTADFTTTTIEASLATSGDSIFTDLTKGQWVKVTAPGSDNDGAFVRLSGSVAPTDTIVTLDAATPLVADLAVTGCYLSTARVMNGTTERSFSIEREFADVVQFFNFRGMSASKLSLSFQSGAIATGSIDFMGKDGQRAGTTFMPGTPVASQTYDVMNAVAGVGSVFEGGSEITGTFIKSLTLEVDNKLRGRTAIGTLGNVSIGSGTVEVKGTIEVYLADGTMYDKFVNKTDTSISWRVVDGDGNGYVFQLPKVNYGDAKVNAGSIDQDAMLSMPFTALMDTTAGSTGKTLLIDRVGAASA